MRGMKIMTVEITKHQHNHKILFTAQTPSRVITFITFSLSVRRFKKEGGWMG